MFGIELAILAMHAEQEFQERIRKLPPDIREKIIAERTAERRHRELVAAIRSTRPRGFGYFY